ncbi:beta-class carbonic anhydrase [Poriferisphaera sp. WC338]|uniref:beta-class carbonic anhydrase n=1 Tax=Poriferisphaera sp. WC338 TaxID=3425129 RepID=UPI003D81AC9B
MENTNINTDQWLTNNKHYVEQREAGTASGISSSMHTVVITCMDCRIMIESALGLKPGQAFVIRNAGNIVTDDVVRSLTLAVQTAGIQEVMVIGHTDCAVGKLDEPAFKTELQQQYPEGVKHDLTPTCFHAFSDVLENVRKQVQTLKSHPYFKNLSSIRGFVYDIRTGKISDINE